MKLCFASNNAHKLGEIRALLPGFDVVGLADLGCLEELSEDQSTLEGNSEQKAIYVYDHYDVDCFADDTGLEVDALNGDPGVYSARYAGADRNDDRNMQLLLRRMKNQKNRKAQFRTVITLIIDNQKLQFEGIVKGEIAKSPKGSHGFGYDPIFIPTGHKKTMAELTTKAKNKISHRGKAVRSLVRYLKDKKKGRKNNDVEGVASTANIKDWSPEDRPREKLITKGTQVLSNAELIAILIRSGSSRHSAVELAKMILQSVDNDLHELARLSAPDFMQLKGIGEAKAVTIVAALELGRRRKNTIQEKKPKITSSSQAFDALKGEMMDLPHEVFWILFLNQANRILKKTKISEGGITGTIVDPKIVFRLTLDARATGIIVAHNHPSGDLKPSNSDIALTNKLVEASKLMDIRLIDHLIIGDQNYLSFADEGLL